MNFRRDLLGFSSMADFTPQAVRGVYPQAMLMGCGSGASFL